MLLETHKSLSWTSFIQISSIASFNPFLIAWLWGYYTFSDNSVVGLRSSPGHKYTKYETIFQKKIMFYYQFFFCSLDIFFIRLFLANTYKKNRGSPYLFPHKKLWKVDMALSSQSGWMICVARTGARNKIAPIVFEVCTRDQACFRLFLCVWYC